MDKEKEDIQTKAEAQDEILLAALKLFAEKGYFNTSLSDIADAAGLKTTNALYQHFKNKQTIAAALYANIFDSLSISVDDIRRRSQKPSEQLRAIVDLLFKLTDEAPDVMQFLLVLNVSEILPDERPVLETPPFTKIIKIIQAGAKAGEIRNIAPQLCFAYFFGIVNTTLRMVLSGELDRKADSYLSQTWLAAWNAIAKK
ncbi:TetR/AcrR family transcriptional regulator [Methylosarcina fibrata]|uniref:TetR/AcrR family transcriptional regulator n=1 Tax=Methylosarcina fibrata TaxID=105972 RepID=UPI000371C362|nr:TetR/AcrR family transcriptional regulator [Methylosarcina fibrata]